MNMILASFVIFVSSVSRLGAMLMCEYFCLYDKKVV